MTGKLSCLNTSVIFFKINLLIVVLLLLAGAKLSSIAYEQAAVIKSPFCSSNNPVSVVTNYQYVYVRFARQVAFSSNRGFVAGYVSYTDGM